jgi:hypothetical protein
MVDEDEASFEKAAATVGDLPTLLRRLDRDDQPAFHYDIEQAVDEDEAFVMEPLITPFLGTA